MTRIVRHGSGELKRPACAKMCDMSATLRVSHPPTVPLNATAYRSMNERSTAALVSHCERSEPSRVPVKLNAPLNMWLKSSTLLTSHFDRSPSKCSAFSKRWAADRTRETSHSSMGPCAASAASSSHSHSFTASARKPS